MTRFKVRKGQPWETVAVEMHAGVMPPVDILHLSTEDAIKLYEALHEHFLPWVAPPAVPAPTRPPADARVFHWSRGGELSFYTEQDARAYAEDFVRRGGAKSALLQVVAECTASGPKWSDR